MAHLPGSFFDQGGDFRAFIRYKVKAEIDSFETFAKKMKHY